MRVLGLAFAGVLAITAPVAVYANGPGSNMRPAIAGPAPNIVLVWDGGGSGGRSGAIGGHPTAGRARQWNGVGDPPRWGPNGRPFGWGPYGWQGVPTYWVWGPSGGAFDYPFADWRGPTGGWGNP
jgi:hypothetical protein